jgi:hypothetical protein
MKLTSRPQKAVTVISLEKEGISSSTSCSTLIPKPKFCNSLQNQSVSVGAFD